MPITFGVYGNIIKVDDTLYAKNSMVGLETGQGWRLKGNTLNTVFPYIDYTQAVNEQTGEKFASEAEFTDWLEQNAFWPPDGGGGGGGVQSVTGTLVTGTAQNPIVDIPTDDQIQTQIVTNTGGTSPFIDLSVAMTSYGTRIYDLEQAGFLQSVQPGTNVTIDTTDPQNPIINAAGGGGAPQTLTKGPGVGEIGITDGNDIVINTIAADGTSSDDPSTVDIGGTGAQVFDLVGAPGIPGGTEGVLLHVQRQDGGGNGEFQFLGSDEVNFPGIFARWKQSITPGDYTDWSRLAVMADIVPYGLGISMNENQATALNDATVGGFYVAPNTDPNRPPEFPDGLWATYLTVGFTDRSNNELASQIAVRSHTGLNFNYLGYRGFEADGTWGVWHRVYDTFNPPTGAEILPGGTEGQILTKGAGDVIGWEDPPTGGVGTLQAVTTNGNTTTDAIQITSNDNLAIGTDGLAIYVATGNATIANYVGGAIASTLVLETGQAVLNASGSNLIMGPEDTTNAGAQFFNRVSGNPAVNAGDFMTLAQATLQGTTEQGNSTDQGINITGDQGSGPQDGLSIVYDSAYPFGAISLNQGGAITGSLEFSPGEIAFALGEMALLLTEEDATTAGAQFTTGVSANYFQVGQITGGGLVIDFLNGSEIKSIASNQTFTFTNQRNGLGIQVRINNTGASAITATFTGADLFGSGLIPAGEYAVFSFMSFGGVITGVKVPSSEVIGPDDIINPVAGTYVVGRTTTTAGAPSRAVPLSVTPTASSVVQRSALGNIVCNNYVTTSTEQVGTTIDFTENGMKWMELTANTTFTFSTMTAGLGGKIRIQNPSAASITLTFTGAIMQGQSTVVAAGAFAVFGFELFTGNISGYRLQ